LGVQWTTSLNESIVAWIKKGQNRRYPYFSDIFLQAKKSELGHFRRFPWPTPKKEVKPRPYQMKAWQRNTSLEKKPKPINANQKEKLLMTNS
jgi:hypothetical protein